MICKNCGEELPDNSKFCGNCGILLDNFNNNTNLQENIVSFEGNEVEKLSNNKKRKISILLLLGLIVSIIVITLVYVSFMNASLNSIKVLEKSLANLQQMKNGNLNIKTNLSTTGVDGENLSFDILSKVTKNNDRTNIQLTLEKSSMFEEMNAYITLSETNNIIYLQSSLIDLLGLTLSQENKWVYINLSERFKTKTNIEIKEILKDINLKKIVDKNHFVFIDKKNDLSHYQLIIDQKLVETVITELEKTNEEIVLETTENIIEEPIKIDFYVNKNEKLSKIEIDITNYLEESENITSMILSMNFSSLNDTVIEIPEEVKNSNIDFDTYMNTYMSFDLGNQ